MFTLFGIKIADIDLDKTLAKIQDFLQDGRKHLVVTANPEIMVYAHNHLEYKKILQGADLVVPDGFGLVLASYLGLSPLAKGRVTGVELAENLIKNSTKGGYSIFLVGATKDILEKATLNFSSKYTKINIVGYNSGSIFSVDDKFPLQNKENDELLEEIKNKKPDIILVAFGHPKQELWLKYYMSELPVKVGIGIGGALDYFAGKAIVPPKIVRSIGLEWLWRLIMEPKRAKRIFIAVVIFPVLVLGDLIKKLFHVEQFKD
jgi:N-acetylglucosaminyldiphosphoundecaprenol N-acetyl-beta-D-mannosaminyltransferase